MATLKLVSITTVAVIFVLLQYLTAPQSSVFSHSNINEGNEWNIPSLHAVLVCLSRLFHDVLERKAAWTSQLRKGKRKDLQLTAGGVRKS